MATARLTRAARRAQTRAALLDAAARVFVERGFAGASVEAITAEAGYTRGAFYSNFASKEELFVELLQERAFARYRAMARQSAGVEPREIGARAARIIRGAEGRWLFRLWLEVLAHAGRDDATRRLAAGFWSGTRALGAEQVARAYAEAGREPPADPRDIASAFIALDVGLALQHFVDPDAVSLDAYPELFDLLFGALYRDARP
ncbi:MAG TPA: TetR/AcrR family transcriptional regulator [Solirubrobacteraceae bacterium]